MSEAHADIKRRAGARVGSVLRGKYRLDRVLGIGGMASVYAATHVNNKSRVAIKMLHAELSVNADIRARFVREGYVANSVEHKGVVRVSDDDVTDDGAVFLVMELLDGETIGARMKRFGGKLPADEVASIAVPLLEVLAAAHAKQIVHRDVKPDNVFVTCDGAVKVLDFGIARLREGTETTSTQSGQTVGTPAFMAPEQALGRAEEVGPPTDVWAVGATMFTLLTGQLPHPARSDNEMLVLAATKPMRAVTSLAADVPSELARIVDKATAFERDARFADARSMQTELRSAMRALGWQPLELVAPPASSVSPADGYAVTKADVADPRVRASNPPPGVTSGAESTDPLAPTLASADTGRATAPTTTAGVASQRFSTVRPQSSSRSRVAMIAGALVIVIGATAGITVALTRGSSDAPTPSKSAPVPPGTSASVLPATTAPAPPATPTTTSTPSPTTTTTETPSAMPTPSTAPTSTSMSISKTTSKPKTTAAPAPSPSSLASSTAPKVNPLDHQ